MVTRSVSEELYAKRKQTRLRRFISKFDDQD